MPNIQGPHSPLSALPCSTLTFFVEEGEEFLHQLGFHHLLEEVVLLPQLLRCHVLLPASHPLVVVQQFNEACVGGFGEKFLIDVFVEPRREQILRSAGKQRSPPKTSPAPCLAGGSRPWWPLATS